MMDSVCQVNADARVYDATIGRFTSVDPLLKPFDGQNFDGYGYVGNNPLSRTDPTGMLACGEDYVDPVTHLEEVRDCANAEPPIPNPEPTGISGGLRPHPIVFHPPTPKKPIPKPKPNDPVCLRVRAYIGIEKMGSRLQAIGSGAMLGGYGVRTVGGIVSGAVIGAGGGPEDPLADAGAVAVYGGFNSIATPMISRGGQIAAAGTAIAGGAAAGLSDLGYQRDAINTAVETWSDTYLGVIAPYVDNTIIDPALNGLEDAVKVPNPQACH
jgi:RHS repeat-associated protein